MVIVKDRFSQLTRSIPTAKITSMQVTHIFFRGWMMTYGIPDFILLGNVKQLVSKFL